MRTVLITGATGFIGSQVVETFIKNHWHIIAITHHRENRILQEYANQGLVTILKGDIIDLETMVNTLKKIASKDIEAIVHCAGYASDVGRRIKFKRSNYQAVLNMAELLKLFNIRKLIFVSTTDVYGIKDFSGETEEELPYETKPINPYPEFKIKAEQWLKNNLSPEQYVIIRPAAVWGVNDKTLTQRIRSFLKTSPYIIHFGKWRGKNRWPLAHVENVAHAIYYVTTNAQMNGSAINVLDNDHITMDQFYRAVGEIYFPKKKFKTLVLPLWLGRFFGFMITTISNLFNLEHPFMDPSLYALYSVSSHLDFSNEKLNQLFNENAYSMVDFVGGCQQLKQFERGLK